MRAIPIIIDGCLYYESMSKPWWAFWREPRLVRRYVGPASQLKASGPRPDPDEFMVRIQRSGV